MAKGKNERKKERKKESKANDERTKGERENGK